MKTSIISVILLLLIQTNPILGQEVNYYNLKARIDVKTKNVNVEGTVTIDFLNNDSITLIVWGNTTFNSIKHNNQALAYTFDKVSKSPIIYIPDGRMLTIKAPKNKANKQNIYFNYQCSMNNVAGWGRSFTDNWIEIGFYTAWFPVHATSKNAMSTITVDIDEEYKVSGSGIVNKKGNKWVINHPWAIYDNVIIASKELKTRKWENKSITLETVFTKFPENEIDSVFASCNDVLNYYQNLYGLSDSAYVKFVLCPTEGGGGYGRKNYISLKTNQFSNRLKSGIAHEMAHFWWKNAISTSTWEDWLNEAFAEYNTLMYTKERISLNDYNEKLKIYNERAKTSVPIWGVDRAKPEAYSALYEKGSLILIAFNQKIGKDAFDNFLLTVLKNKVSTTVQFLNLVETEISAEMRNWFEEKLKEKGFSEEL